MDPFTATMIAEGAEAAPPEKQKEAWEFLIDTGLCWKLQGWFGRTAQALLDAGVIVPKEERCGEVIFINDEENESWRLKP